MREIKFRGYDTELEEMTYFESDDYILQYGDILREHIDDYDNFGNPELAYESVKDKVELMQYTGLKDKNGKEIYEGDIVNDLYSEDELVKPSYYTIGVIKYIEDMSGFFMVSSKNCISSIIDVEVIGNIYDNPELLERNSNGD